VTTTSSTSAVTLCAFMQVGWPTCHVFMTGLAHRKYFPVMWRHSSGQAWRRLPQPERRLPCLFPFLSTAAARKRQCACQSTAIQILFMLNEPPYFELILTLCHLPDALDAAAQFLRCEREHVADQQVCLILLIAMKLAAAGR